MTKIRKCLTVFMTALCLFLMAMPGFAATNKAVRLKMTFEKNNGRNDDNLHVFFGANQKTKNTATKNMTISGTLYVPTDCFAKTGEFIIIDPMVNMFVGERGYGGTVYGKYKVQAQKMKNGTIKLYKVVEGSDNPLRKIGTLATCKQSGDFYKITLKDLPLCSWAFDGTPENRIKINTTRKFYFDTIIRFYRHGKTSWKGTLFFDNITLKATKTQKMTFDKEDYGSLDCYAFSETVDPRVKVALVR